MEGSGINQKSLFTFKQPKSATAVKPPVAQDPPKPKVEPLKVSNEPAIKVPEKKPIPEIKPAPIVKSKASSRMAFLDDDIDDIAPPAKESQSIFKVTTASTSSKTFSQFQLNSVDSSKSIVINDTPPKSFSASSSISTTSSVGSVSKFQYKPVDSSNKVVSPPSSLFQSPSASSPLTSPRQDFSVTSITSIDTPSRISIKFDSSGVLKDYERLKDKELLDALDHQQLMDEQAKFYKHYYELHSQLPLTMYDNVEGYDKATVVKVKSIIQSINLRIKRKESQNKLSSLMSGIKTKKKVEEEQFDIDDVMKEVEAENRISNGKFNNSYVDLSGPSTSSAFQPRINMKNTLNNSNTAQIDDDGFPVVDLTQLVDVVPGKSQTNLITSSLGQFHANVHNDGITGEFDRNFSFSQEIREKFKDTFGLREFRQNQLQAINATMLKLDCFILMPTGGGKSLCYQLPAVCDEGVTIVVSPLKSLIFDQTSKMNTLDIKAVALSGEVSTQDARDIYSDINSNKPKIRLLYITPEKIAASTSLQDVFTTMYSKGTLARIVIDEAHCVSTWGHDFRPDYKRLGELKRRFPNVPIIALTATANPRVRADVVHQLSIPNCKWFLSSFNRPNLKYIVLPKKGSSALNDIIQMIKVKYPKCSGIIYCLSRKDCETTAEKLQMQNISAICYHAGLSDKVREKVQRDWIADKVKIVCATIAFGMGIDKPDVRFVIHYSLPKSIEGYYQEAGRAGRDGKISTCILYYSYSDKVRYLNMISKEPAACQQVSRNNLDLICNFCENMVDCRRSVILNYFGEHFTREQCLQNEATGETKN